MTDAAEELLWCKATVDTLGGSLSLTYRWSSANADGSDYYNDEDVSEWDDRDIVELAAALVGFETAADRKKVQIIRE